ncbi:probable protein phosphatase 2C 80 [Morus notabilis]|uniref:probable protein phosphatase 2C 80 n=1 Tax=Morus notabilis TaxID=981085 RepID=UPI000CED06AD|nr:probable protein phosphatase 2C 80 [Morus notabilis]
MKIVIKNGVVMKKREVEAAETEKESINEERLCKRLRMVIKKRGLRLVSSSFYIPKGELRKPLGEDAYFAADEEQTFGVADGVAAIGVGKEGLVQVDLKGVLQEAFSKTKLPAASTACILTHNEGVLRAINVGDGGFMVFRDRKLLYTSPTQQHHFNCPYQLGNAKKSNHPNCAVEMEVKVMEEDLIVMATTDGLFDNMHPSEIEKIIERFETEKKEKLLLELAKIYSIKEMS